MTSLCQCWIFHNLIKEHEEGDHQTDYATNHDKILAFHIIVDSDPSSFVFRNTKLGPRHGPVDQRCEPLNPS